MFSTFDAGTRWVRQLHGSTHYHVSHGLKGRVPTLHIQLWREEYKFHPWFSTAQHHIRSENIIVAISRLYGSVTPVS